MRVKQTVPIFGLPAIEPLICFSEPVDRTSNGTYDHYNGAGTVWINPTRIDPAFEGVGGERTARQAFERVGTVVHELRHAFQVSALYNPEQFMVSEATMDAWRNNYPRRRGRGHYIQQGNTRADGEGYYVWRDFRNQPIEVDAFGFGDLTGWRKE